jgi:hypothetical protein
VTDDDWTWLAEIPSRPMLERGLEARFPLPPGDRPLLEPGAEIAAGDALLEHVRDSRIEEVEVHAATDDGRPVAGTRWAPPPGRHGRHHGDGELLTPVPGHRDRWRLVTGEHRDTVASPLGGTVTAVCPGGEIRVCAHGPALRGAISAGTGTRGRLELATDPFGELRPGGIDVGRAGSILVVGARIDAEALTRARAMGVRGIVVASLPGKELRDFQASERRQRAGLHPTLPFGVLALDGAVRRPIARPVAALLERMAGTEVALLTDPPALVFDVEPDGLETLPPDWVRVRSGINAGLEGRVIALLGRRRFSAGVMLDAARIAIQDEPPLDVAIGDLERFT